MTEDNCSKQEPKMPKSFSTKKCLSVLSFLVLVFLGINFNNVSATSPSSPTVSGVNVGIKDTDYGFGFVSGEPLTDEVGYIQDTSKGGAAYLYNAEDVFVFDNYAYVVSTQGDTLSVIDVSSSTKPVQTGYIQDGGTRVLNNPSGVFVSGNYAYVSSFDDDGLSIIDITNPASLTEVGHLQDNNKSGTAQVLNGANDVFVSGNYAYVTSFDAYISSPDNGLSIIDISVPSNPVEVGYIQDDSVVGTTTETHATAHALRGASGVFVLGSYAYVTSDYDYGLTIVNVSSSTNPVEVGYIQDNNRSGTALALAGASGVFVSGNYAYVASPYDNALSIVDISDPAHPTEVGYVKDNSSSGTAQALNTPKNVFVSGNYAYVSSYVDDALSIIDISDPAHPTEVEYVRDNNQGGTAYALDTATSVFVSGNYAYLTTLSDRSLSIIDISRFQQNKLRYGVDWDVDNVVNEWLPASGYLLSGTQTFSTSSWSTKGNKTFQVLAEDSEVAQSGWTQKNIVVLETIGVPSGQWGVFLQNIGHTGFSSSATSSLGALAWNNTDIANSNWATIDSDGTIYTSEGSYVYALNTDGTEKWNYYSSSDSFLTPGIVTADGDLLLVSWNNGDLILLSSADGTVIYTASLSDRRTDEYFNSALNVDSDGTIYLGSYTQASGGEISKVSIRALNYDFSSKWIRDFTMTGSYDDISTIPSALSPSLSSGGTIYFADLDGIVYALNSADGTTLWSYDAELEAYSTPAVSSSGVVYLTTKGGCLHAINSDGTMKWKNCLGGFSYGSAAVGEDGTIYAVSGSDVFALNPADGSADWQYDIDASETYGSTPAIASDGTIYYHSYAASKLFAINADGTVKWEREAGQGSMGSSPVIADNGTVYATSDGEGIFAFDNSNPSPEAPTITGATEGFTGTIYEFGFLATDDSSSVDSIRYGIDWDTDNVVDEWLPTSDYVISGTQASTTYYWRNSGARTFQALAEDDGGARSSWSQYSITINSLLTSGSGGGTPSETTEGDVLETTEEENVVPERIDDSSPDSPIITGPMEGLVDSVYEFKFVSGGLSSFVSSEIGYLQDIESGGTVNFLDYPKGLFVSGNYAYVTSWADDALSVINISDPANPLEVGSIQDDNQGGTAQKINGATDVFVSGDYAYVVSDEYALSIINISDKSNPIETGFYYNTSLLGYTQDIFVSGDYAYIPSYWNHNISIINISDKSNPTLAGFIKDDSVGGTASSLEGAHGVYISGDYAYVVSWTDDSFSVIDISNKANPVEVATIQDDETILLEQLSKVFVSGDYAYVISDGERALSVIDISVPNNPVVVGSINGSSKMFAPNDIFVSGSFAYVTGATGVFVVDISNPTNPTEAGFYNCVIEHTDTPYGISVAGDYAYVSSYNSQSFFILDVSSFKKLRYGIDWDNDSVADEWLPASGYLLSGIQASSTHQWSDAGTKTFRAVTEDDRGLLSFWSQYKITIQGIKSIPTAKILQLKEASYSEGVEISFKGMGKDKDGTITAAEWRDYGETSEVGDCNDGVIVSSVLNKENSFFSTAKLSLGEHNICFRVQDNDGLWSKVEGEHKRTITIIPKEVLPNTNNKDNGKNQENQEEDLSDGNEDVDGDNGNSNNNNNNSNGNSNNNNIGKEDNKNAEVGNGNKNNEGDGNGNKNDVNKKENKRNVLNWSSLLGLIQKIHPF